MGKKLNIHLSFSGLEKNARVLQFIRDLHKLQDFEVDDSDKDYNAGNDYFNLLLAGVMNADYFIRILSDEKTDTGNLGLTLGETKIIEDHCLKILQVNFNEKLAITLRDNNPDDIIYFTKDYTTAFKELQSYVNSQTAQDVIYFQPEQLY